MTKFAVLPPMIVVRVPGAQGGETYMRAGRVLPDSVSAPERKRLLRLGLIAEVPDEALVIAELSAAQADADRVFEERVRARAAELVAEELAPEFDQRVQEAAEKLDAERQAAEGIVGSVTTVDGQEHVGVIPDSAAIAGPDERPTPAWSHEQINNWAGEQTPPIAFEADANKATKLAEIAKRLDEQGSASTPTN